MKNNDDTLGARVREAMGEMKQGELARALGVKQPQISRLLTRPTYDERARSMRAIAEALGVDVGRYVEVQREHGRGDEAELARQLTAIAEVIGVDVAGLMPTSVEPCSR